MSKTFKDLCVTVGQYTDKEGKLKNKYKKIGVEVCETDIKDGRINCYLLLDRDVNLAGFPNFSGQTVSTTVLVSKFEKKEREPETEEISLYQEEEVF